MILYEENLKTIEDYLQAKDLADDYGEAVDSLLWMNDNFPFSQFPQSLQYAVDESIEAVLEEAEEYLMTNMMNYE